MQYVLRTCILLVLYVCVCTCLSHESSCLLQLASDNRVASAAAGIIDPVGRVNRDLVKATAPRTAELMCAKQANKTLTG